MIFTDNIDSIEIVKGEHVYSIVFGIGEKKIYVSAGLDSDLIQKIINCGVFDKKEINKIVS
jgi:hypothetical protein